MVSKGKCRLFMRKDGKYLIYIPKAFAEDSMFPFPPIEQKQEENEGKASIELNISFLNTPLKKQLIIEETKD